MKEYTAIVHPLEPVFDKRSKILILGTMPSPKSREQAFYYAHPRNRFWQVMEALFSVKLPEKDDKIRFLLSHKIALWDVLHSCEIISAADSTIRNPAANDIKSVIDGSDIGAVFTTGKTAFDLYRKLCLSQTGTEAFRLPSTSPANAAMTLEKLIDAYSVILKYL